MAESKETVVLVLPLPPSVLSPNGQHGHWYKRAAALKKCRMLVRAAVESFGVESGPWQLANVRATFYHKVKRRRDGVNYNSMLKGYFDGIVDAQLVQDDDSAHWVTRDPEFLIDGAFPRVEITVERVK